MVTSVGFWITLRVAEGEQASRRRVEGLRELDLWWRGAAPLDVVLLEYVHSVSAAVALSEVMLAAPAVVATEVWYPAVMLSVHGLTAPGGAGDHEPVTHAARPARGRRVVGAGARAAKALLLPLLLCPELARAEVPDGYTLVFQSGFNPGVSIAGGNGCGDRRRLAGVDSVTGYSWDDLPGDPSANYFNDVIVDGAPDCCPQGCAATSKDECHTLDIVSGLPQYDGSVGYGLRGVLLQDCSSSSYSRIQYNMYDADPPVGDPLEDLEAYYAEIDVILPNPEVVTQLNGWLGILENYDTDNYAWKSALVLDCLGGGSCPQFYMYNCRWQVDCTLIQDNPIAPQAGVPFKLRIWYRASTTDGLFKITYTCPACTPPVSETTIGEFAGQTIDEGDLDVADIIKVSGTWGGVEMDWTESTLAAPSPGSGGAGAAAVGGAGGNGGSGAGGSGGSGTGAQAGAASAPTTEDGGGCGCRLASGGERQGWIGLAALVCLGALRRRRALPRPSSSSHPFCPLE